jgi:hypothetical protein
MGRCRKPRGLVNELERAKHRYRGRDLAHAYAWRGTDPSLTALAIVPP